MTRSSGPATAKGSMSSFGDSAVSQWATEEPTLTGLGAYMRTWPLGCVPLLRTAPAATAWLPIQCRSPVSLAEATRSALVICAQVLPVL